MDNTGNVKWNDTVINSITESFYKSTYKAGVINNFNTYVRNKLKKGKHKIDKKGTNLIDFALLILLIMSMRVFYCKSQFYYLTRARK